MSKFSHTKTLTTKSSENLNAFQSHLLLPKNNNRIAFGGLRTKDIFKKSLPGIPLITIITAVFNGEKHLEETIKSIINQTYPNIEFIIIDGGSTDKTLEIIQKYEQKIDYWTSEKDNGISDAFNKGVSLALGDYINFQGDGDGFLENDIIQKIFRNYDEEAIFICGRIQRVSQDGDEFFFSKHIRNFNKRSLLFKMSLPHQGLFTHINYFKRYGLFDTKNIFCMDYEHLLRSYQNFPKVITKDIIVAKWRADGLGNGRTLEIYKEYDLIKKNNKISPQFILFLINYWSIFKYYFKNIISGDKFFARKN